MKRIIFVTLLGSLLTLYAHAQVEGKRDSISIKIEQLHPELLPSQTFDNQLNAVESVNKVDAAELERRAAFVKRLEFQMPVDYVGPLIDEYAPGQKMPWTNEYGYYQYVGLNDDFSLSTASFQKNYPTVGNNRMVSGNFNFAATDWLTLSGGAYVAKYNMSSFSATAGPEVMHYNDLGFNAALRFKLHDRVYLHARSQYSVNSFDKSRNFSPATRGMFPQTYYGGGVEFKVTNKFGVEGGMTRELNPMNGKWTNSPYIMPVFYPFGKR